MEAVVITCSICSEYYKSTDEIYSTSCGHVFHSQCIVEWQRRSSNCPQCRTYNSGCKKIYLNFEDNSHEKDKKIEELKSQLEQSLLNASVLQQNLDDSERDFLNIQKQFTEYEELLNEVNKKNEYLVLQNDSREKDIANKIVEIHRLQEALNASSPQGSSIVLQEEINVLNEKLKQITLKLQREIHNTTQLEFDKMKLQSMLDHATKTIQNTKTQNQISIGGGGNNNNQHSYGASGGGASGGGAHNNRSRNNFNKTATRNEGCIQSILIQNIKETFIEESSMMAYVSKLIKLMNLSLRDEDIQHVSIFERNNSETASLLVKFKSLSAKAMFLSNKRKLQNCPNMQDVIIKEYVGEKTNNLFYQARTLKGFGYKHVYCKNNIVFVRKDDGAVPKRINRREDIDELKSEASKCKETKSEGPNQDNKSSPKTNEPDAYEFPCII